VLRSGYPTDWEEWHKVRSVSRDFLVPWESTWPADALTYDYFCGTLRRHWREWREGKGYTFFILRKGIEVSETTAFGIQHSAFKNIIQPEGQTLDHPSLEGGSKAQSAFGEGLKQSPENPQPLTSDVLIGGIALNDVRRGMAQKGTLGYWIGEPYARQGYMSEAVGLVCSFAFETLKLHRLEAGCLPRNEASRRLLARLGFMQEGFARAYLRINGKWEDHILWGMVKRELK